LNLKFGVPCSKLKNRIRDVDLHCTCEEEAFGIAAGCILAGKKPKVYMQNSGLGRSIDILTSLYKPYGIPYPQLILSLREKPEHHKYIGCITYYILDMLNYKNVEVIEQNGTIKRH
jgi:sulfopyruvate decarboxylase TPP-binding subunit